MTSKGSKISKVKQKILQCIRLWAKSGSSARKPRRSNAGGPYPRGKPDSSSQPGRDRVQTVISAAEKPLSEETADNTKVRISSNSVRRAFGGICPSYVNLSDKSESKGVAKESIRKKTRLFDTKLRWTLCPSRHSGWDKDHIFDCSGRNGY
jgi:hypothetical protein